MPKTGSPLTIDITTIGTPTPAGIAFVKFILSPTGLALHKQGRIHAAQANVVRSRQRGAHSGE